MQQFLGVEIGRKQFSGKGNGESVSKRQQFLCGKRIHESCENDLTILEKQNVKGKKLLAASERYHDKLYVQKLCIIFFVFRAPCRSPRCGRSLELSLVSQSRTQLTVSPSASLAVPR